MEESYDHQTNTISVADGNSSEDNASFGSINKYESDSEEEVKPQLKIKRSVPQYVKHIAEKKAATSPLNSSIESKSPTADETDRKIMLALSRYQSHLSQLKEVKPTEVPPPRAPTPPPQLPPTPPPRRPVLPADSPAVSVNIGIGSIDFKEAPPVLYPTESESATHFPAGLNETASTLLMTAALNALTSARGAQTPGTTADPLTTALAAASAQILAAALNKPPPVPVPPPAPRAPTPPPPTPPKVMATVATETDTPPPSPRVPKGYHDHLRRTGSQLDVQALSNPNNSNAGTAHTSAYDRMMASRGLGQAQGSGKAPGQPQGTKPHYHGAAPAEPPLARRGSFGNKNINTTNTNTNTNTANQNKSVSERAAPVVPPLAVSGLASSRPSLGVAGGSSARAGGEGSARGSGRRDSWPNLPPINTAPLESARADDKPQDATTTANTIDTDAESVLRSSLSASVSPTTAANTINNSTTDATDNTTPPNTTTAQRRPSSAQSVHSATSATSNKSLRSVKSLTFAGEPENSTNHATEYGERIYSDSENPENMADDGYFGSENAENVNTSPSFKDFHLKYAKGLMAIESIRSDSFSPKSAFSVSPRNGPTASTAGTHGGSSGSSAESGEGGGMSAEISELDENVGGSSARSNDDACSAISDVYSGSSEVYSGTNTYNPNNTTNNSLTYSAPSFSLSPTPHVDARVMMDTLLNGTDSVQNRLRIEAEYQPPVNMYTKQFHSVDPRVFEAVYEDRSPTATTKKSPRALYRNSIMQLITTTPGFINSPRNQKPEYEIDYSQFNTDYESEQNTNNNESSVDGSESNFGPEEEKSEISEYSSILSESVVSKVSSLYTVHSIPGVADKRTGGCMIHRTVSNTGTAAAPVSKYYNVDPATIIANASAKDNKDAEEKGVGIADVQDEDEVSEYSSVESEPIASPNTSMYKHKHNLSMYTTTGTTTSTPPPTHKRPHSTPHLTHANSMHSTTQPVTPHTHRLIHTNSTRSVHRSFKYDDSNKAHILGRQTTSIKGQNKLHDSALEFKQDQCLNSIDAKNLKLASIQNRNVLVGWQVLILKKGEMSLLGLAVITGVRTNMFFQTEYRISSDVSLDCWVRLKRGKGMGGTEFQPLRKVLTTKQGSTKMRVVQYKKTM